MTCRNVAWILVLIVEASFVAWGAMAAALPHQLIGPNGLPIIAAGYEGFTQAAWSGLLAASPPTAGYIEVLFRTYGMYNVGFGVLGIVRGARHDPRGTRNHSSIPRRIVGTETRSRPSSARGNWFRRSRESVAGLPNTSAALIAYFLRC